MVISNSERVPVHANNSTTNLLSQFLLGGKLNQNPNFGIGLDQGDFKVPLTIDR